MATSTIKDYWPNLQHHLYIYSTSTDLVVTNGSETVRSGTLQKTLDSTTLEISFQCYGYVNILSGGFHLFIDGADVASAITVFTQTNNAIVSKRFVNGISAGNHTYELRVTTQGNNSITVPAWQSNVVTISEIF